MTDIADDIADWLYPTIEREMNGAQVLAADGDLLRTLGEKTLGPGGGERFIDHISGSSQVKLNIIQRYRATREAVVAFRRRVASGESLSTEDTLALTRATIRDETLSEVLSYLAAGYYLRPGFREEWRPASLP
ncbi:hypothetical protein ACFYY8_14020 [Streptosporangium sp. NPDC001559]|uniref:hypothetical protein n=1 Tax=Streptosporangium sp. NPDC001559 TaxID=3366187 RepID=UPI0036F0CA87